MLRLFAWDYFLVPTPMNSLHIFWIYFRELAIFKLVERICLYMFTVYLLSLDTNRHISSFIFVILPLSKCNPRADFCRCDRIKSCAHYHGILPLTLNLSMAAA